MFRKVKSILILRQIFNFYDTMRYRWGERIKTSKIIQLDKFILLWCMKVNLYH